MDFYRDAHLFTPEDRQVLLTLVKRALDAGAMKESKFTYRDAQGKIPTGMFLVVKAPQGQWVGTIARENPKGHGWMTASLNITLGDVRAAGLRA